MENNYFQKKASKKIFLKIFNKIKKDRKSIGKVASIELEKFYFLIIILKDLNFLFLLED